MKRLKPYHIIWRSADAAPSLSTMRTEVKNRVWNGYFLWSAAVLPDASMSLWFAPKDCKNVIAAVLLS